MYIANGNEMLKKLFKIQMEQLQQEMWTPLCFAEIASQVNIPTRRFIGDALVTLGIKNFHLCDHENKERIKIHRNKYSP